MGAGNTLYRLQASPPNLSSSSWQITSHVDSDYSILLEAWHGSAHWSVEILWQSQPAIQSFHSQSFPYIQRPNNRLSTYIVCQKNNTVNNTSLWWWSKTFCWFKCVFNSGVHTNGLEGEWAHTKRYMRVHNCSTEVLLQKRLNIYMWKRWLAEPHGGAFLRLLQDLREQYTVWKSDSYLLTKQVCYY